MWTYTESPIQPGREGEEEGEKGEEEKGEEEEGEKGEEEKGGKREISSNRSKIFVQSHGSVSKLYYHDDIISHMIACCHGYMVI